MSTTTHLSPDEVESYALAGEEALHASLDRHLPEMQAAFWHAIQRCYVQAPSPIAVPDIPVPDVPVLDVPVLDVPVLDLAIVPDPAVLPPAHVIQAAVELQ